MDFTIFLLLFSVTQENMDFTIFLLLFSVTQGFTTKKWRYASTFYDPENWVGRNTPSCKSDIIRFPNNLETVVSLPDTVDLSSLILPNNGELFLPNDGVITLQEKIRKSECNGKIVEFKNLETKAWFDPNSWYTDEKNKALIDVETIPCTYDNVEFPKDTFFQVQLPDKPMKVNSIRIDDRNMNNDEFTKYIDSEIGRRQFLSEEYEYRDELLKILENECTDVSGCHCHSMNHHQYYNLYNLVCGYVYENCPRARCLNPIKPQGHCCDICGSIIAMEFNKNKFDIKKMSKLLDNHAFSFRLDTTTYISKVFIESQEYIQIVIREYPGLSSNNISEFTKKIEEIITSDKSLGIISFKTTLSGWSYPAGSEGTSVGIMFICLLIAMILFSAVFLLYYPICGEKYTLPSMNVQRFRPFLFARFENVPEGETALEFRSQSITSSILHLDRAFSNPLYSSMEKGPSTSTEPVQEQNIKELTNIPEKREIEEENIDEKV